MKKIFALIIGLSVLLAGVAFADSGDYLFKQGDDGIYICGYTGTDNILRLPEVFGEQPVVGVASGAFRGNRNIVEVYVPDSYKVIDEEAFADCTALRDVYLGSGIEAVNARAFAGCPSLLSISLVQYDFYEDPTAYEGSNVIQAYNGADMEYLWETTTGEDYDLLYIAACDLMSRGEFEQARDIFLSLYGYELSADNYFYCAARVYENEGNIDEALAIYALMPDLNDCADRLAYYGGTKEVASFFEGPEYNTFYSAYFGSGGRYQSRLAAPAASEVKSEEASEEIIGGADASTGIVVGENLNNVGTGTETTPEPEVEATPEPAPAVTMEPNPALMSYHEFADDMPFEFDDLSKSEGYYAMYYYYDDIAVVDAYIALFEQQGWTTYAEEIDGWMHVYVSAPNQQTYFYVSYEGTENMLVLMYESGMDYGFDPKEGL